MEELYRGHLGIFTLGKNNLVGSEVVANDPRKGQKAWLRLGMWNVEWDNLDNTKGARKRYNTTAEEWELAGLRLEWNYLQGNSETRFEPTVVSQGC